MSKLSLNYIVGRIFKVFLKKFKMRQEMYQIKVQKVQSNKVHFEITYGLLVIGKSSASTEENCFLTGDG